MQLRTRILLGLRLTALAAATITALFGLILVVLWAKPVTFLGIEDDAVSYSFSASADLVPMSGACTRTRTRTYACSQALSSDSPPWRLRIDSDGCWTAVEAGVPAPDEMDDCLELRDYLRWFEGALE